MTWKTTFLEVASMVVTWWIVAFLPSACNKGTANNEECAAIQVETFGLNIFSFMTKYGRGLGRAEYFKTALY